MNRYQCLRAFRSGGRTYRPGDVVDGRRFMEARLHVRKGRLAPIVEEPQPPEPQPPEPQPAVIDLTILDGKAVDAASAVRRATSREALWKLEEAETAGGNRLTVLNAIERRLEELGAEE